MIVECAIVKDMVCALRWNGKVAVVEKGVEVEVGGEGDGQWYEGAGKAKEEWVEGHGDIRPVLMALDLAGACLSRASEIDHRQGVDQTLLLAVSQQRRLR